MVEHGAGFDFILSPDCYRDQNQTDMNKHMILKSDALDIIFEKRNKLYGAYILRKFYPNRLKLALGLMLITALAFSAFTLIPGKDKVVKTRPYIFKEIELRKHADKPKEPEKRKDPAQTEKPSAKAKPVQQKKYISNVKVVRDQVKTDTIVTLLPTDVFGSKTLITASPGTPPVVAPVSEPGDAGIGKTIPAIDQSTPLNGDAVDVLPAYPGGLEALRKFLIKHLVTPDELQSGETVSVRVKFVVDYNGKLKSFETLHHDVYNKEVVRVLKKMPDWIPGKTKGENVSVYYVMPVRFETGN